MSRTAAAFKENENEKNSSSSNPLFCAFVVVGIMRQASGFLQSSLFSDLSMSGEM